LRLPRGVASPDDDLKSVRAMNVRAAIQIPELIMNITDATSTTIENGPTLFNSVCSSATYTTPLRIAAE